MPFFLGAIDVPAANDTIAKVGAEAWHGPVAFALHGFQAPAFWLVLAGFALATAMYWWKPSLADKAAKVFAFPRRILENKYGFDDLWINGFAGGSIKLGKLSRWFDSKVIDGAMVNGSASIVGLAAGVLRKLQSGYLYAVSYTHLDVYKRQVQMPAETPAPSAKDEEGAAW